MENEIKFLKEVIAAQDKFLICYRLGGSPPEWAFAKLNEAKKLYGDLQKIAQQANTADEKKLCQHPLSSIQPVRVCWICGENLDTRR